MEVRAYAAVETDYDGGGSPAFRRLFDYITGANGSGERIAMTGRVDGPNRRALPLDSIYSAT